MTKYMVTVVVGVFVGAFALEIMGRKSPALLLKVRMQARRAANDFRRSFIDGYDRVLRDTRASSRRPSPVTATSWPSASPSAPSP